MAEHQVPEFSDAFEVDGERIRIRPIMPEDREREASFVRSLSSQSRYYRFHSSLRELTPEMLARFTECHYPNDLALVAYVERPEGIEQIGVARYFRLQDTDTAEIAIVVADAWQGKGVATRLLLDLRDLARRGGIARLVANVLRENGRMLGLCRKLGFGLSRGADWDSRTSTLGKHIQSAPGDSYDASTDDRPPAPIS